MHQRRPDQSRGPITAAIALAVALPFNVLAAEPTPDPPEPHLIGTIATGIVGVGGVTGVEVGSETTFRAAGLRS
jgi:hypothetical protein